MTSVNTQAPSDVCPNCKQPVTVPKSTRSFICRSCDAVIKVIGKDAGVELKVVGKSVEEDPEYLALEVEVAALKSQLDALHVKYLAAMAKETGKGGSRLRNLGVLAVIVGVVALPWSAKLGGAIALVGLVAVVAGMAVNSAKKRAKHAETSPISDEMHRIGAQRDLLQRKAARLKTLV
jgi:hypothetical protein